MDISKFIRAWGVICYYLDTMIPGVSNNRGARGEVGGDSAGGYVGFLETSEWNLETTHNEGEHT